MSTLLSINNYYYPRGGAETVFLEQNRMFTEHGWNVVPFCMKHRKNLPSKWSEYFVEEIEFGSAYSVLEKLVRVPKVIYSLEAREKLGRLLDRVRPDICHAHNIYNHISPSILSLLRGRNIPTVLTLHDLKLACPAYNMMSHDGVCERCKGGRFHNVLVHRCIKGSTTLSAIVMLEAVLHSLLGSYGRNVDRFLVPSRFYIKKFVEWGMPAHAFTHVPNFVDTSRVSPMFDPGGAFLYFGRVSPEKGLATLLHAAARVKASLWIAGTGPQLDELKVLARELNSDVTFLGYLAGESLRDAVRSSRAVVVPSEWYENAPMAVLEAYSLGKAVVGASIGGIPELIREGETGHGFESGNVESLAEVLQNLMARGDNELRQMGQCGRQWVENDFTAEQYRQRVMSVYRELNGSPGDRQTASTTAAT